MQWPQQGRVRNIMSVTFFCISKWFRTPERFFFFSHYEYLKKSGVRKSGVTYFFFMAE